MIWNSGRKAQNITTQNAIADGKWNGNGVMHTSKV